MAKTHRGKTLRAEIPRSGRGYCTVTKRAGVKLLYDYEVDGKKIKISKLGKAILENRRIKQEKERAAKSAPPTQTKQRDETPPETKQQDDSAAVSKETPATESE